jgi:hypothetical protein
LAIVFLLAGAIGCVSTPKISRDKSILFERAIVNKEHVDQSIYLENKIKQRYEHPPPTGANWFEIIDGNSQVVITAPHATGAYRSGKLHFADTGTGSLALMLHRITGVTVMYTTYASPSDPNYYDNNCFKNSLAELIDLEKPALVIDIHSSHYNRPYDADFGTLNGVSLLDQPRYLNLLSMSLFQEGLKNLSQDYFSASKNQTITKWVSQRGIPCIQLEISSTWLTPKRSDLHAHRYAQLLQGLSRFILNVLQESRH